MYVSFLFLVGGMSLEALKTAASGTKQDLAASSNQSLSRRQSSFADWNKILTLKLRIRDPLITKHCRLQKRAQTSSISRDQPLSGVFVRACLNVRVCLIVCVCVCV